MKTFGPSSAPFCMFRDALVRIAPKLVRHFHVIPDLAVEVLSPFDSAAFVGQKIGEYLESGVPLVWLVDPAQATVTVYRSLTETERLSGDDVITADPVLPGFSARIAAFFP